LSAGPTTTYRVVAILPKGVWVSKAFMGRAEAGHLVQDIRTGEGIVKGQRALSVRLEEIRGRPTAP